MTEHLSPEGRPSSRSLPPPPFPPSQRSPQVWFLTCAFSPLAVRLIRLLLAHGDSVAAGLPPKEAADAYRGAEFATLVAECRDGRPDRLGWDTRLVSLPCEGRVMAECGVAVAQTVEAFGRIDVLLCCTSEAVVGTVEELGTNPDTQNLVREQFETVFFSQVNFIKAALPLLRAQHHGHVMILTGISGHIGTPGMGVYSASIWALEGFCDSLAYEVAPMNIKVTIVQPNKEVGVLSHKITLAPQLPQYESHNNPAPGLRDVLTTVLNRCSETRISPPDADADADADPPPPKIVSRYPLLPSAARDDLVMETVYALTAIGGHENPPARHIVGHEGVTSVKEKLKTVSEELEDFVEVSCAVDITKSDGERAAGV